MPTLKKFGIVMAVLGAGALLYYLATADFSRNLVLIGTVDANQVIVSARVPGRIEKLPVDEGTEVRAGDLIALLEAQDLAAQRDAATATVASLRSRVQETQATQQLAQGETTSGVAGAIAQEFKPSP